MKLLHIYETAKDSKKRIAELADKEWQAEKNTNLSCIINIDKEKTFQTFKGFGCAVTESAGYVLSHLSEQQQQKIMSDCFCATGNNYAFARTHMNSCDFSLGNWACVQEKDETLSSFSFERTDKYITPALQKAFMQNKSLSVMVTPWTPPAWMKTNNDMNNGGKLKKEYFSLWAEYFVKFLIGLKERGLNPKYVSIQNECEATQIWDSCIWTGTEEAEFAVSCLKPAFEKNGLGDIKILIWDHNRDNIVKRMKESFSVPGAEKAIDGMAFHWYSGDQYDNVSEFSKAYPGKDLFFTEGSIEGGACPGLWFCGERYGHNIINDLNAGCTAWIDWNMALDMEGGPNHVNNFCDASILINTETKEVLYQNSFYYIGHFSRFIKPGSKRLGCNMVPFMVPATCDGKMGNTMESTAFLTPEGKTVLIVMNRTEDKMVFEVNFNRTESGDKKESKVYTSKVTEENIKRSFTCPPRAIQTYIFETE
ncbi:MAG: glucosylceramidase [Treponema sp.]|nr:glucosylceramidase [Treponema sp.]